MAQLAAVIVTSAPEFKQQATRLLRAGGVPVGIVDERAATPDAAIDIVVVDIRGDTSYGLSTIERMRGSHPVLAIFAIASAAEPDLILQAMRAGANEFFTWSIEESEPTAAMAEAFHAAVKRTSSRREAAHLGSKPPCSTLSFVGAKGGVGTTTVAVNCAVEIARITKRPTVIVDLKPSLGEVTLFLGVRPRYTILDAVDNLHRLDREFLKELVASHKSGLDILAGSEQLDRPNGQDSGAIEQLLQLLARMYDFVVIDTGNLVNACSVAALYAADSTFLVTNPDVPSIRNAQRVVERIRQLGAGSERTRVLLNRATKQHVIAPRQIETALGMEIHHTFPSDYQTVASALNAGVPLALSNNSDIAAQFDAFTRLTIGQPLETMEVESGRRTTFLGMF